MDADVDSSSLTANAELLLNIQSAVNATGAVGRVEMIETENGPMTVIFMDDGVDSLLNAAGETQYVFDDVNNTECEVITSETVVEGDGQTVVEDLETTIISQPAIDYITTESLHVGSPVRTEFITTPYISEHTTNVTYADAQTVAQLDTGQGDNLDVVDGGTVYNVTTSSTGVSSVTVAAPESPEKFTATPLYQYKQQESPLTIDMNYSTQAKKAVSTRLFAPTSQSLSYVNTTSPSVGTGATRGMYQNVKNFPRVSVPEPMNRPGQITRSEELQAVESIVSMDPSAASIFPPSNLQQNTAIIKPPTVHAIHEKPSTFQQQNVLIPKVAKSTHVQKVAPKILKSKSDMVQVIRTVQKSPQTDSIMSPKYVYKVVKPGTSSSSTQTLIQTPPTNSDRYRTQVLSGSGGRTDIKPKVIQIDRQMLNKGMGAQGQTPKTGEKRMNVTYMNAQGHIVTRPESLTKGGWGGPVKTATAQQGSSSPFVLSNASEPRRSIMTSSATPFVPKPVTTSQQLTQLLPKPETTSKGVTPAQPSQFMVNKTAVPVQPKPETAISYPQSTGTMTTPKQAASSDTAYKGARRTEVVPSPAKPQSTLPTQTTIRTIEVPNSDVKIQIHSDGTLVTCDSAGTSYGKISLESLGLDANTLKGDTSIELVVVQADGKEVRATINTNLLTLPKSDQSSQGNESVEMPDQDFAAVSGLATESVDNGNEVAINVDSKPESRPYKCSKCPRTFKFEKTFKCHEAVHEKDVIFTCEICKRVFAREDNLKTHESLHEKIGLVKDKVNKVKRSNKEYDAFNTFDCVECDEVCGSQYNLGLHMQNSHGCAKLLACTMCEKLFMSETAREMHMVLHESSAQCRFCREECKNRKALDDHLRADHQDKIFDCVVCHEIFRSRFAYSDHLMQMHTECEDIRLELMNKELECKECGREFQQEASLKVHMRIHSEAVKPKVETVKPNYESEKTKYQCPHCFAKFTTKFILKQHIYRAHNNNMSYSCDKCGMRFKRKDFYRTHVEQYHTGPYNCECCPRVFDDVRELVSHKFSQHGVGISCRICHAQFEKKIDLMKHKSTEHRPQANLLCDVCGAGFVHKTTMKAHLVKEHFEGNKEQMLTVYPSMKNVPEECEICKQMLQTQMMCKLHYMNAHFNGQQEAMYAAYPFLKLYPSVTEVLICDHCGKLFAKMSNLRAHLRSHGIEMTLTKIKKKSSTKTSETDSDVDLSNIAPREADKDYKCSECRRTFARKAALLKHMADHEERYTVLAIRRMEREDKIRTDQDSPSNSPKKAVVKSESPKKVAKLETLAHKTGKVQTNTTGKGGTAKNAKGNGTLTKVKAKHGKPQKLAQGIKTEKVKSKQVEDISDKQTREEDRGHSDGVEKVPGKRGRPKLVHKKLGVAANILHRKRGRPAKPAHQKHVTQIKVPGKRGRPAKNASEKESTVKIETGKHDEPANESPRKRGRPRKSETGKQDISANEMPRKRGRPSKIEPGKHDISVNESPKKRGRPPKVETGEDKMSIKKLPGKRGRPAKVVIGENNKPIKKITRARGRPAIVKAISELKEDVQLRKRGRPKLSREMEDKSEKTRKKSVQFKCKECGKTFRWPASLNQHTQMAHGEKKKRVRKPNQAGAKIEGKKSRKKKMKLERKESEDEDRRAKHQEEMDIETFLGNHFSLSKKTSTDDDVKPSNDEDVKVEPDDNGNIEPDENVKIEPEDNLLNGKNISSEIDNDQTKSETNVNQIGTNISVDEHHENSEEQSNGSHKYPCRECGNMYSTPTAFLAHYKAKHPSVDIESVKSEITEIDKATVSTAEEKVSKRKNSIEKKKESTRSLDGSTVEQIMENDKVAYRCKICYSVYSTTIGFNKHLELFHPMNKSVKKSKGLRKGTRCRKTEKNEKPLYSCSACMRIFSEHTNLSRHMVMKHKIKLDKSTDETEEQIYECKHCSQVFSEESNMSRHVKMKHHIGQNVGKRKRSWSPGSASKRDNKKKHKQEDKDTSYEGDGRGDERESRQHAGTKPARWARLGSIKCNQCIKTFKTKKQYVMHRKLDHYQNSRKGISSKRFRTLKKSGLQNDRIGEFSCGICFQTFIKHIHYKLHLKKHKEKSPKKASNLPSSTYCATCKKAFSNLASYNIHLRQKHIHEMLGFSPGIKPSKKDKPCLAKKQKSCATEPDSAHTSQVKSPGITTVDAFSVKTEAMECAQDHLAMPADKPATVSSCVEYFFCDDCKRPFWSKQKFLSHTKHFHPDKMALELDRMVLQQLNSTKGKAEHEQKSPKSQRRSLTGPMKHKCEFCQKVHWTKKSFDDHMATYHAEEIAKEPETHGISPAASSNSPEKTDNAHTYFARLDTHAQVNFDQLTAAPVVLLEQLPLEKMMRAASESEYESSAEQEDVEWQDSSSENTNNEKKGDVNTAENNAVGQRGDDEELKDDRTTQHNDTENTISDSSIIHNSEHNQLILNANEEPSTDHQTISNNKNEHVKDFRIEKQNNCDSSVSDDNADQRMEQTVNEQENLHDVQPEIESVEVQKDFPAIVDESHQDCMDNLNVGADEQKLRSETIQPEMVQLVKPSDDFSSIDNLSADSSCAMLQEEDHQKLSANMDTDVEHINTVMDLKSSDQNDLLHAASGEKDAVSVALLQDIKSDTCESEDLEELVSSDNEIKANINDVHDAALKQQNGEPKDSAAGMSELEQCYEKNASASAHPYTDDVSTVPVVIPGTSVDSDVNGCNIGQSISQVPECDTTDNAATLKEAAISIDNTLQEVSVTNELQTFQVTEYEDSLNNTLKTKPDIENATQAYNITTDTAPSEYSIPPNTNITVTAIEPFENINASVPSVPTEPSLEQVCQGTNINASFVDKPVDLDDEQLNVPQNIPHLSEFDSPMDTDDVVEDEDIVEISLQSDSNINNKMSDLGQQTSSGLGVCQSRTDAVDENIQLSNGSAKVDSGQSRLPGLEASSENCTIENM